jgi:cytochrome c oxidase subunit 4
MRALSERLLSPAGYVTVLVILVLLTLLTVGLSFLPSSGLARLVAGQSVAAVKASLVVLFFMHALRSPAQTRAVIAVTLFWFVLLLVLILSDYFTRGMIPNLPGH